MYPVCTYDQDQALYLFETTSMLQINSLINYARVSWDWPAITSICNQLNTLTHFELL